MLRRRGGKYKRELRKRGSGSCGASRAGSVWVALAGRESYRYRMKLAEIKTAISGLSEQERVELAAWVLKSLDELDEEEAERLCDRVGVLEGGTIVALDTPGALIAEHAREVTVRFSADAADLGWLRAVAGVDEVTHRNGSVEPRGRGPVLAEVGAALVSHGIRPADLRADQPNLEDVFLSMTGRRSEE